MELSENLAVKLFLASFDKRKIDEIRRKNKEKSLKNASGLALKDKKSIGKFSDATEWILSDVIMKNKLPHALSNLETE